MIEALEARLHAVRHRLADAARHLTGAKVLAARLYGVGPVTGLAMTCWLAGGCDQPASRCEPHHVHHRADGGPTSIPGRS